MRIAIAALAVATMACATAPPDDAAAICRTEGLNDLVGRQASQELGEAALGRSGARTLRWIRPGDAVTMDYSPQRLNVHLDEQDRVARFACG